MTPRSSLLIQLQKERGWQNQYRFILKVGQTRRIESSAMTEQNVLPQCSSRTWLHLSSTSPNPNLGFFSESKIINGFGWILLSEWVSQNTPSPNDFDIDQLFKDMAVNKHLSASRSHGLKHIVGRAYDLLCETAAK